MKITFEGLIIRARYKVLTGRLVTDGTNESLVALEDHGANGGERLQVSRFGKLRNQIFRLDRQAHFLGARTEVQIEASDESLASKTVVSRNGP